MKIYKKKAIPSMVSALFLDSPEGILELKKSDYF